MLAFVTRLDFRWIHSFPGIDIPSLSSQSSTRVALMCETSVFNATETPVFGFANGSFEMVINSWRCKEKFLKAFPSYTCLSDSYFL